MSKYWTSAEDFEADLLSVSDFCGSFKKAPSPTEHAKKARSKKSLYDDPSDEEEEFVPAFGLGRGYPLIRRSERRPGGVPSILQEQSQTEKEIREVCGGAFANDVIEHSLKTNCQQDVIFKNEPQIPDIRLTRSPASGSSSKYSTPSSSPLPTSNEQSPAKSANVKHKQEAVVTNSEVVHPATIYSQQGQRGRNCNQAPPIYDIVKSRQSAATQNPRNSYKPQIRKQSENYLVGLSSASNKSTSFNLNSNTDFPELR